MQPHPLLLTSLGGCFWDMVWVGVCAWPGGVLHGVSGKLQERSQTYWKLGVLPFAAEIYPCLCRLRCSGLCFESHSETIAKRRSYTAKNQQFKRFHSRLMRQDIKCHFLYFKEGSGHSEGKIKRSTTTCLAGRSVLTSALNLKATRGSAFPLPCQPAGEGQATCWYGAGSINF